MNAITISRTHIHRLETALSELEELADSHEMPSEFLKALHYALRLGQGTGLTEDQGRLRLDKVKELRILPEYRADRNLED